MSSVGQRLIRAFPIPANDVLHVPLDNLTLEPVQARLMNALEAW